MLQFYLVYIICFAPKCLNQTILLLTEKFRLRKLDCSSQKPLDLRAALEIIKNRISLALIGKTTVHSSSRGCKWTDTCP